MNTGHEVDEAHAKEADSAVDCPWVLGESKLEVVEDIEKVDLNIDQTIDGFTLALQGFALGNNPDECFYIIGVRRKNTKPDE
jgi:hypothetical protein